MPVTNYHTLNGRIRGETTNGVRTNYLSDALGSVTGTVNSSAQIQNRYRNRPYGARLYKTGNAADPRFQWNGTWGYLNAGRTNATHYVRARTYDEVTGRWTSPDSNLPVQPAYTYCKSSPVSLIDPNGHQALAFNTLLFGGVPDCCVNGVPGIKHGATCKPISINFKDRRAKCWIASCEFCENATWPGVSKLIDDLIESLAGQNELLKVYKCGVILSCIGRCSDEKARSLGCWLAFGGHHGAPLLGMGCCVQAKIDLCCFFSPWVKFGESAACRPQNCGMKGSGVPKLKELDKYAFIDPIYLGPGMGSTSGCLKAIISAYSSVNFWIGRYL